MIYYDIRFKTGNATFQSSADFALLSYSSSNLPVDQTHTSMIQNGYIFHGIGYDIAHVRTHTDDSRIGIGANSDLHANTDTVAIGIIMLN